MENATETTTQKTRLEVGDKILRRSGTFAFGNAILTVTRVTETRAFAGSDGSFKFHRKLEMAYQFGNESREYTRVRVYGESDWERNSYMLASDAVVAELQAEKARHALIAKVRNLNWATMPTETLERVLALLDGKTETATTEVQ